MHSPGLTSVVVENARLPSQLCTDSIRPPCYTIIPGFPLTGVGQWVTMLAGKYGATIEDSYAPTATFSRTEEPRVLTAKVAVIDCTAEADSC